MTVPYTYYLYHKPTGKKYYGVRYKKGCHPSDLWNKYFSSSKEVKKLIEEYGIESFDYKIRKTFNSKEKARDWETKVLQKLNVIYKEEWINKSQGRANLNNVTYGMLGKTHSEETKKKMSKAQSGKNNPMYGKKHTKEAKEKIKNASIGNTFCLGRKLTEEHKEKIGLTSKGRYHRPESIEKIKEARKKQVFSAESREKMRQSRLRWLQENK